jgi:hypothetical protein
LILRSLRLDLMMISSITFAMYIASLACDAILVLVMLIM